ncbi:unnamed protein product [Clonostachys chloroleuca]|uniref:Uncharacterized protein n=1 Tax=Clonostachys chloroleuca TaxID=1926264 RepID=A0AA35M4J1_9HYPO|nr:unnamed protein product [Clonostachys chloroleuca]
MHLNVEEPECFTSDFISAIVQYFASIGISCIAMDYQKECRHKGRRCAPFTDDEVLVHGLASVAEISIAQRLYGINIASTIAISHSTVHTLSKLGGRSLPEYFGDIHRIQWHPAQLTRIRMQEMGQRVYQRREEQINDEEAEAIVHRAVQRGIDAMRELDL